MNYCPECRIKLESNFSTYPYCGLNLDELHIEPSNSSRITVDGDKFSFKSSSFKNFEGLKGIGNICGIYLGIYLTIMGGFGLGYIIGIAGALIVLSISIYSVKMIGNLTIYKIGLRLGTIALMFHLYLLYLDLLVY